MLVDIHHAEKPVTRHPHEDHMRLIRQRAGDRYLAMMEALDLKVHDKQVATSSWMPPPGDWLRTPFAPLAEIAAGDRDLSGRLFGCLVWQHFMDRPERWAFGRYEKNGEAIGGITYFQV